MSIQKAIYVYNSCIIPFCSYHISDCTHLDKVVIKMKEVCKSFTVPWFVKLKKGKFPPFLLSFTINWNRSVELNMEQHKRKNRETKEIFAPFSSSDFGAWLSLTVSTERKVYLLWLSPRGTKAKLDNPGWLDSQLIWVTEKLTLRVGTVDVMEDYRKDILREENQPWAPGAQPGILGPLKKKKKWNGPPWSASATMSPGP